MVLKTITLIVFISLISCSSIKNKTEIKEVSNQLFFKPDGIYSEKLDNNSTNIYYFSSIDSIVYFSKITKDHNDSVGKQKLSTIPFGRYLVSGNNIKVQQDIDKLVKIKPKSSYNFLFMFLPTKFGSNRNVTLIDKEIITEGEVKKDSIILTKEYLGTEELNFKKRKGSKTIPKNSLLIFNANLKGIVTKESKYSANKATIVSN
ncbi:hypothetical protein OIU80_09600 [Flavobacterium sp. LS1R47]|uniref:Lipoprotein n=1 Tax=Flavobacterium frigoritolerans TaxID=2987686 RepID=A0A9X2ZPZ9_9FLAO|nr:hypothetical protein [Flavobacterium frigoritolerans]MCV9932537.1 hypothetical protein [Flavobacterium frigoritolerans]